MDNLRSMNKFILSLDLGQKNDYSVLSIIELFLGSTEDPFFVVRKIRRYPLNLSYPDVVARSVATSRDARLHNKNIMVIDYSGVGRPVVDLFRQRGAKPVAITVTSGARARWSGNLEVTVPKKELVFCLQLVLQSGNLVIPANSQDIEQIKKEFFGFRIKISASGGTSYEARLEQIHDDIVMSLAMGIWYGGEMLGKGKRIGVKSGYVK